MRFLNVLPLALGVSSLLIPPQVDKETIHIQDLPVFQQADEFSLNCDGGCPVFPVRHDVNGIARVQAKTLDSKLVADIVVNGDEVFFNGQQVWPRTALPPTLSIKQPMVNGLEPPMTLVPVSSSIEYKPSKILSDDQEVVVVYPIEIEIMAVGNQVVKAERVELRVAQSAAGVGVYPSAIMPYRSSPLIDSCTNVWCRVRGTIALKYNEWREALANKFRSWRKCGRKSGHKIGNKTGGVRIVGGPNKFAPGATLHPHKHHGHHHRGGFFWFLRRAFRVVVIPIVLGLGIGMTIGAITKAIVLYVQRRRTSTHGEYAKVKQSEIEEGRASIDGPPKYEEVYGEEAEKEDEKK
ncbi:MAG: hypothetical protein GOMPHAMPRED_006235 [Gomphillus americanus]|uniref:Uncharacterized protein n=1 Tax=Gomphillus americanus TaxID=1940652 RepID=A0A8H3END9_9LECA|nr:MAG: hypothetical protein GOMPHAMPRED_006235 [Gomphillus americanus]